MAEAFHYLPELFNLLVDTILLLCRSKQNVILFLRGAGVAPEDLAEVERSVKADCNSINKFEIVRNVLTKVNARGDNGLRARREILRRVVEFESFKTCWESDQYKAKGLVASIREAVNKKDSFTRMKQERDAEREQLVAQQKAERAAAAEKRAKLEDISKRLEGVLNDLFRAHDIHVREDFRRKDPDTSVVLEQIDGVIELDGTIHLVEMKWLSAPVGIGEFSPIEAACSCAPMLTEFSSQQTAMLPQSCLSVEPHLARKRCSFVCYKKS